MSDAVWVAALYLLGMAVLVAEVFVPSGGVLGFVSVAAFVSSIAMAYGEFGAGAGTVLLGITALLVPAMLGVAFRWFPETPLGRRVLPPPPEPEDVVPDVDRRRQARGLVGQAGCTETDLLPWGRVTVGGRSFDGMSESGPIDRGTAIDVVGVEGVGLVVRPRSGRPEGAGGNASSRPGGGRTDATAAPPGDLPEQPEGAGPDRLSPTLETFSFEALEDPDA